MSDGKSLVKVVRTDGGSKSFLLDPSDNLATVCLSLQNEKFMGPNDAFLNQGSVVASDQELQIELSQILASGVLNIGQGTVVSPISGQDTAARYNLLTDEQKRSIYGNIQVFRGLSITKDGFDKTFRDVYSWDGGYLPAANAPHVNTELMSSYSFSKVTHDLTVFGSSSTSVNFSSPYASGEAEYKEEHSKSTSDSKVTEYLVTRYVVRKALLQVDTTKLVPTVEFVTALGAAIHGNEDKLDGYYNLIKVLDEWGYYVPQEFTLGGVIYATDFHANLRFQPSRKREGGIQRFIQGRIRRDRRWRGIQAGARVRRKDHQLHQISKHHDAADRRPGRNRKRLSGMGEVAG